MKIYNSLFGWFPEEFKKLEPFIFNLGLDWETEELADGRIRFKVYEVDEEEIESLKWLEFKMVTGVRI
ncbi:MAG: hypothetical protein B6D63_07240 [Candidatus Latescibacteria bacterium 4484_7]|nr:MAG: hypothetical protein B6D63_07240 [Candidatus Latescibacteria bacterium 4484_7]